MDLDLISFLKDGEYRIKVLEFIGNSPMLPSELAKSLNINRASVSRILKSLKEKGLITSTSGNTRTILYSISNLGKKYLEELKNG